MSFNIEQLIIDGQNLITQFGVKILAAIGILILGWLVAKIFKAGISKIGKKDKADETVFTFLGNLASMAILAFTVIAGLGKLGVQTASFVAVIGAAGLAIGLAFQGSLANFAAGFLMVLFRPFKVGDFIEGAGTMGVVKEIEIFTTTLMTPDNKKIIIPNSKLTSDNITNFSTEKTRRVDIVAGVGYGDDIDKVRSTLEGLIAADSRILKDPEPFIAVGELADSSVNFTVRVWAKTEDYWPVKFDMTEAIKKGFDKEGINIPFPQQDVHLYKMN